MSENDTISWPADTVERRRTDSLIPYARNARTHSPAQVSQLAAAIQEWGFTVPVVIDENGGIIAGHGRVLAAQKLKLAEVPCVTARGWSDAKRRAYVLADNKLALNAGWDEAMLRLEVADLSAMGAPLQLAGFDVSELKEMEIAPPRAEPATPRVPKAALGFNLVFEDAEQQKAWFDFVRYLRANVTGLPGKPTLAALLRVFLDEHGYRA